MILQMAPFSRKEEKQSQRDVESNISEIIDYKSSVGALPISRYQY